MQPLTRHGHRGHAVFVLPARPRRAAGTGRQPHPPCEKRAQPHAERPARHIAAKIRPVAQNSGQPHAMPCRSACRAAAKKSGQPHGRAMPQATAGRQSAPYGSHTAPRPATKIVLLVARRTPRHAAPPAAPRKTLGPAAMPGAAPQPRRKNNPAATPVPKRAPLPVWVRARLCSRPASQNTRPPPVRAGARFLFVRFVPSSSMSRSAQSQEPRRTIAKTTARGRPPVTSLRKVLSATRRAMPPRLPRRKKRLGQPPCRAHRPSPATKIVLLVAHRTPRTHRPARHISAHNPANRAKIGQHPTGRTAPTPPQK